jgi:DNA polymerase/3'-5' exonuclease PolX
MILEEARCIADKLVRILAPTCHRIEIAGSVRRQCVEVGDIEIVAIPDLRPPRATFGSRLYATPLSALIGSITPDDYNGLVLYPMKDGPKYKQLKVSLNGGQDWLINLDLFLVTPPADWGVLQVIRTGPAAFSKWIVSPKFIGGGLPSTYRVEDGAVWKNGTNDYIPMPEEINFLNFCGMGWIEPQNRRPLWEQSIRQIPVHQGL